MDFKLSKEQELIQKTAKDFAEKYVLPIADQIDRENKVPPEIYKKMAELELFGIPFSEEFGGTGAGYSCYPLAVEQIAKASGGVSLTLSVNSLGTSAINIFGTPEQKKRYMVPCCRGKEFASFAFTEPGTGSDPKQITSTAVKDGDSYILNGTKRFISAADLQGPIVIFAKDNETNYPSAFIAEKFCPGYSISEPWHKIGMRGGMMVDVYLKDVRVPAISMSDVRPVGPVGEQAISLFAWFGLSIAAVYTGIAIAALKFTKDFCAKLKPLSLPRPIKYLPAIQFAVAEAEALIAQSRALYLGTAQDYIRERRSFEGEAGLARVVMPKYVATNNALEAVDCCMEAVGAHGMLRRYPMERYYRDVRAGVNHPLSNARARELIGKTALGISLAETPRW